nr:accessory gene regulator B family protein [uncultured Niameybacter sp.]
MKIENFSNSLAKSLGEYLQYSEEQVSILAYGLYGLLQTIFSLFLVIAIGLFLGITLEALIVSFSIAILRKFSGGAHATSAERCLILGTLFAIIGALLGHLVLNFIAPPILYYLEFLLFIWSFYIIYKYAPVASPNKPIINTIKITRLKQRSIFVTFIYFVINIILLFISNFFKSSSMSIYSICLTLGMSWQTFTLTKLGHNVAKSLDHVLITISNIITKERIL